MNTECEVFSVYVFGKYNCTGESFKTYDKTLTKQFSVSQNYDIKQNNILRLEETCTNFFNYLWVWKQNRDIHICL